MGDEGWEGGPVACSSKATSTVPAGMGCSPVTEAGTLLSVPDSVLKRHNHAPLAQHIAKQTRMAKITHVASRLASAFLAAGGASLGTFELGRS